jgi:quinolinate synthase
MHAGWANRINRGEGEFCHRRNAMAGACEGGARMHAQHDDTDKDLIDRIARLKKERGAVILAHNYQRPEIQDLADYVEDSLGLARIAASVHADVIVFCGVHFMAETAAMLNPESIVLLPDRNAGCPMADMATPGEVMRMKKEHPGALVMCYVNTSAAVKAECDICCTSSNAVALMRKVEEREIIFVPDKSLGAYAAAQTDKKVHLYPGFCPTHHRLFEDDVVAMKEKFPAAHVMAHPECTSEVLAHCDFIGSTSALLDHARISPHSEFLVGTESGILHRLGRENPGKSFHLLSERLVCPTMKLTALEKVLWSLQEMRHRITVPEEIRERALKCIERMLAL